MSFTPLKTGNTHTLTRTHSELQTQILRAVTFSAKWEKFADEGVCMCVCVYA